MKLLKIIAYLLIPFSWATVAYILRQYDITNTIGYYMAYGGGYSVLYVTWFAYGISIITKTTYNKLKIKLN
jgi:hypothetical protein